MINYDNIKFLININNKLKIDIQFFFNVIILIDELKNCFFKYI